jgi:alpha-L-rhamnosidase
MKKIMKYFEMRWKRSKTALILLSVLLFFGISCVEKKSGNIKVSDLKCEYRENPVGIESSVPRLSWLLHSSERGQMQNAYRILVATSLDKLNNDTGDVWDSQKVNSDRSVQVPFKRGELESSARYYWKVKIWDENDYSSGWSEPAFWEMGLLHPDDWKAKWIAYNCESAPLFRKEFEIGKKVRDARIYISGIGYYELSMNGSKIGDHVLDPGQTDYEQRTFYVVYDVTADIKQGNNAIGVMLGDGWYHQTAVNHGRFGWTDVDYGIPRLICQLHLTFTDGSRETVVSDETWKAAPGPVTFNNVYAGEHYDARLEHDGWNTDGFDDSGWETAELVEGPGGKLVSQKIPPIKKIKTIEPVDISNPKPGVYVYNMGQNFSGWARLKLKAEKGTKIRLRFAEWLTEDGMIDPASTGSYATGVVQTDKYICKGDGVEIWEPRFSYHGFQYVEMTGFPGTPKKENLEGVVVNTALDKSGTFECSDSLINKLHQTALWTLTSNLHSIPTDCPHRERCGWLGDAFLVSDMTNYNFDAALFWSKFIRDIETSRRGGVPNNIAPGRRFGGKAPDWGAAFIKLPWTMFLYYNDTSIISAHYEGMRFFMDHLEQIAEDYIIYQGIGSLFSPGRIMPKETPPELTTTTLFYFCSEAMARMAKTIGRPEDASRYALLAQKVKKAFNEKFYDISENTYGGQEKNTLALALGLVSDQDKKAVAHSLNRDVAETHNGHISTGIFGSRYIHSVLAEYGYGKTLKSMLHKNKFPGYGYLFSRGATTFWENWGELDFEDRNSPADNRSKNHPFQGGFTAWLYDGIGGINPDPENPGFKHIILRPQLVGILDWASVKYNSIHGLISSKWQNTSDEFIWAISVPVNTTATIYIPTDKKNSVIEGGISASEANGVRFLRVEHGSCLYEIGSGNFLFKVLYKCN